MNNHEVEEAKARKSDEDMREWMGKVLAAKVLFLFTLVSMLLLRETWATGIWYGNVSLDDTVMSVLVILLTTLTLVWFLFPLGTIIETTVTLRRVDREAAYLRQQVEAYDRLSDMFRDTLSLIACALGAAPAQNGIDWNQHGSCGQASIPATVAGDARRAATYALIMAHVYIATMKKSGFSMQGPSHNDFLNLDQVFSELDDRYLEEMIHVLDDLGVLQDLMRVNPRLHSAHRRLLGAHDPDVQRRIVPQDIRDANMQFLKELVPTRNPKDPNEIYFGTTRIRIKPDER